YLPKENWHSLRFEKTVITPGLTRTAAPRSLFQIEQSSSRLPYFVNWHEPLRCQRSIPTVAAENSVRVLPWHSIRLASESRNRQHPHHSLSGRPQPRSAAAAEHSAIEQTKGAIRAPLKVDHSQSNKFRDWPALLPQPWQSQRPQCVTTTRRLRHSRRSGTVAVAPVGQHRRRG